MAGKPLPPVIITHDVRAVLSPREDELVALLDECYLAGPWNETREQDEQQAKAIISAADHCDVVTAVAVAEDGRLIGVAQGGRGRAFLEHLRTAAPQCAESIDSPVFELWQLVVGAGSRGQQVGSSLHDAVMADVRQPALLFTHPEAGAAMGLYARRGWTIVADGSYGEHSRVIRMRPAGNV